jgi:hypothetical protein
MPASRYRKKPIEVEASFIEEYEPVKRAPEFIVSAGDARRFAKGMRRSPARWIGRA